MNFKGGWKKFEEDWKKRICQNFEKETRSNSSGFKETRIILQGFFHEEINSWGFEINNSSKIQREWINFRERN